MPLFRFLVRRDVLLGANLSALLLVVALLQWFPVTVTEALGFITGGLCVWLVVKQNIWNWPIGIANNIAFIFLFYDQRLFADMTLQYIYIVLSAFGWYWWLHGGQYRTELRVNKADPLTIAGSAIVAIASTAVITWILIRINGSAPYLDAVTTTLSLAAQYLMTRKLIESWYVWIAADLIYIPLYLSRGLYLTAILYTVFLWMCVMGLLQWRRALEDQVRVETAS